MAQQFIFPYPSPVGTLTLAGTEDAITGLWFRNQKYFGSTLNTQAVEKQTPALRLAAQWLDSYFHGENPAPELPLAPSGSPFRQAVWEILCRIPYGSLTTYGTIARQLAQQTGKAVSAQAVGGAVGHNPISILIPCHRVVGAAGSLTGYAAGIDTKIQLLRLEGVSMEHLFRPDGVPL
ncbi:MAG: methylated-DNA--[protein]-cysteine S-methyltransferase [Eubacteriales bacterium]|nr:methylated-DNA--[protein]-cysteine S-methyltransferase [Eubacteriales bacterium]